MAEFRYCWWCKTDVPMLDEKEWKQIAPHLDDAIEQIKHYRQKHNASLAEARQHGYGREALREYHEITGHQETHPDVLWHHRLSLIGPICEACGKPLRTPHAKFCAECGTAKKP